MHGPYHFAEAERLDAQAGVETNPGDALVHAVRALTHAQLANAAATVTAALGGGLEDSVAWDSACGVPESATT